MSFVVFIGILVVLILVHELGHFLVAKAFRVRVDEFGIFFPPRIAAFKYGETEYSINWLPFGGFVKIFGENAGEGGEDPRSLSRKPRPLQAAVMLAGIVFNILFAWLVLSAGYMAGLPTPKEHTGFGEVSGVEAMVVEVLPHSPAERAGLKPEDILVHVESTSTILPQASSAQDITDFIAEHSEESIVMTVLRGEEEHTFLAKPEEGLIPERKAIGMRLADVGVLSLSPHLALLQGAVLTYQVTIETARGLGGFFASLLRGTADFSSVSGPIGIVAYGSAYVAEGYVTIILLTASISIALAIFNLVPIPGLDGGRLLFIIVESILRRPLPTNFSLKATLAGFALLVTLMLVVSYHDIARLVG